MKLRHDRQFGAAGLRGLLLGSLFILASCGGDSQSKAAAVVADTAALGGPDGAADGALSDGALSDGALSDGALSDGALADTPAGDTVAQPLLAILEPAAGTIVNQNSIVTLKLSLGGDRGPGPWQLEASDSSGASLTKLELAVGAQQAELPVMAPQKPGPWKLSVALINTKTAVAAAQGSIDLIINAPPAMAPVVALLPAQPVAGQTLEAKITTETTDPDGGTITYSYKWQIAGALQTSTGNQLISPKTAKGQQISVVVTPSDGHAQGPAGQAQVTVVNAPPTAAVVASASGTTVGVDGTVSATITAQAFDLDGDTLSQAWSWSVGGTAVPGATQSSYSVAELAKLQGKPIGQGAEISAVLTVSDGEAKPVPSSAVAWKVDGGTACAKAGVCGPLGVCVDNGSTQPDCACNSSSLGAAPACVSVEGVQDTQTKTVAAAGLFAVNLGMEGTPVTGQLDLLLVSQPGGVELDAWHGAVMATSVQLVAKLDKPGLNLVKLVVMQAGKITGTHVFSVYVNTPPQAPKGLTIAPAQATANDTLTTQAELAATDSDPGQTVSLQYLWAKNGVATNQTGATVPAGVGGKGQTWSVQVRAFDGFDLSSPTTAQVTLGNAPPLAVPIAADTTAVGLLDTVAILLPATATVDADGDAVTATPYWSCNGVPTVGLGMQATVWQVCKKAKAGDKIEAYVVLDEGQLKTTTNTLKWQVTGQGDVCATTMHECPKTSVCTNNGTITPDCTCPAGAIGVGYACFAISVLSTPLNVGNYQGELPFDVTVTATPFWGMGTPYWGITAIDAAPGNYQGFSGVDANGKATHKLKINHPGKFKLKFQLMSGFTHIDAADANFYGNQPPTQPSGLDWLPKSPKASDSIELTVYGKSTDPDTELNQTISYEYHWMVGADGVQGTGPTIPAGTAKHGQTVYVEVNATDGMAYSSAGTANFEIANTPPPAFTLKSPPKVSIIDTIVLDTASLPVTDAEGENVSCKIQWYKGNSPLLNGTAFSLKLAGNVPVDKSGLKVGDSIRFRVTCTDTVDNTYFDSAPILVEGMGADVCKIWNPCDANATCLNNDSVFPACACNAGYAGDGFQCTDINECLTGKHDCGANAKCSNLPGSYSCACSPGYAGDGKACTDIDECAATTNPCGANATCSNTVGSFACTCKLPYKLDSGTCVKLYYASFSYSLNGSTWSPPAGTTLIETLAIAGAGGGSGGSEGNNAGGAGGAGGLVKVTKLAATPGQWQILVGSGGNFGKSCVPGAYGASGGTPGGGAGGAPGPTGCSGGGGGGGGYTKVTAPGGVLFYAGGGGGGGGAGLQGVASAGIAGGVDYAVVTTTENGGAGASHKIDGGGAGGGGGGFKGGVGGTAPSCDCPGSFAYGGLSNVPAGFTGTSLPGQGGAGGTPGNLGKSGWVNIDYWAP